LKKKKLLIKKYLDILKNDLNKISYEHLLLYLNDYIYMYGYENFKFINHEKQFFISKLLLLLDHD